MTPDDVKQKVETIRASSDDAESAHSMEDELYENILTAIRDGTIVDAVKCCEEALKTKELKFPRWCA